jgi:tRNA (guanine26-N2/guanine27-N2)-dimethyltransferase
MYSHRDPQARVDVVDLDPYGTAAPFIDAAVQSVRDGGEVLLVNMDPRLITGLRSPLCNVHGYVGPGRDQLS